MDQQEFQELKEALNVGTHYPDCCTAVAYVEYIICGRSEEADSDGFYSAWDMIMAARRDEEPITPPEVVDILRSEIVPVDGWDMEMISRHMNHPRFLTYIAGKMGAV